MWPHRISTIALLAALSGLPGPAGAGEGKLAARVRSLQARTAKQLRTHPGGDLREALLRAQAWLSRAQGSLDKRPSVARKLATRAAEQLKLADTLRELSLLDKELGELKEHLARLRRANDRRAQKLEEQKSRLELLRTIQK